MTLAITTTSNATTLRDAFLASNSGVTVTTPTYTGAAVAAGTLDAAITLSAPTTLFPGLIIPKGIALSTGTLVDVPAENTSSGYGISNGTSGDASVLAAAQAAPDANANATYDAAVLEFDFTINDTANTAVSFDVVFGSDEYPEFASSYVDIGAVIIDGVNYALFDGKPTQPLSVLQSNVNAGYFLNNGATFDQTTQQTVPPPYPIEYDGISHVLKIVASSLGATGTGANGAHHIKIGIADTNDGILDSTVFLANFQATNGSSGSNIFSEFDPTAISNKKVTSFIGNTNTSDKFFDDDATTGTDAEIAALIKKLGITQDDLDQLISLLNQSNFWEDSADKSDALNLYGGDDTALLGLGNDKADGGAGNDNLDGEGGNDFLKGDAGNDDLSGGIGNDNLDGGGDDDMLEGDEGNDKLAGGAGGDELNGGDGNDNLSGSAGDDDLSGGNGKDGLAGGDGDDAYHLLLDDVSATGKPIDTITEKSNEGSGTDTVYSEVSFTLPTNVENLILEGTADINGTGNKGDNTITGNSGANQLAGKEGADTLTGGLGADIFVFNTKLGTTNIDTIADFVSGTDDINLSKAVFKGYAVGADLSNDFVIGTAAVDSTDHFIYNSSTGDLYYDIDGSGSKAAIQFATLTGATTLIASDLHIV